VNKKIILSILVILIVVVGIFVYLQPDKDVVEIPEKEEISEQEEEISEQEVIAEEDTEDVKEITTDIAKGELAPDFTLESLNGDKISLSDYRGKYVLVNFWATWCGFCDMEMPDLQKFNNENEDLVVLAVNVMEEKKNVQDYIEKGGYDFDVVLDSDGAVTGTYLVSGFPTSYFIDKGGILLGGVPSMLTYDQMNELLNSIRE
jgi:thiol-disulfide isomerase/thioredoxin